MNTAFPTLIEERESLGRNGIDADASLHGFIGSILGLPADDPKVVSVIAEGTAYAAEANLEYDRLEVALTPTEVKVVQLLATGLAAEAVGESLGIGLETVKTHSKNIRQKLSAENTTHAVALCYQLGHLKVAA